jgi:predicted phosphatase
MLVKEENSYNMLIKNIKVRKITLSSNVSLQSSKGGNYAIFQDMRAHLKWVKSYIHIV